MVPLNYFGHSWKIKWIKKRIPRHSGQLPPQSTSVSSAFLKLSWQWPGRMIWEATIKIPSTTNLTLNLSFVFIISWHFSNLLHSIGQIRSYWNLNGWYCLRMAWNTPVGHYLCSFFHPSDLSCMLHRIDLAKLVLGNVHRGLNIKGRVHLYLSVILSLLDAYAYVSSLFITWI